MTDEQQSQFNLLEVVPETWGYPSKASLYLEGYHMLLVDPEEFDDAPITFDVAGVRAVAFHGGLPDIDRRRVIVEQPLDGPPKFSLIPDGALPESTYLVMIARIVEPDSGSGEGEARAAIARAIAIVRATLGPNAAYMREFDGVFIKDGRTSFASPYIVNPLPDGRPRLGQRAIESLAVLDRALDQLPPTVREGVNLSLRWADRAAALAGPDAFLTWWVAIETIAPNGRSKVKPIVARLAALYGMSQVEAGETFHVGRLYGIRKIIVHGGDRTPIHGHVLDYMRSLWVDLLHSAAGLTSSAAHKLLSDPNFDLDAALLHRR